MAPKRPFRFGDRVRGVKGLQGISGRVIGVDWGADDTIQRVVIQTADCPHVSCDPRYLRYETDKFGFAFTFDPAEGLTVFRNDRLMTNVDWLRRFGLKKLGISLRKSVDARRG